MKSSLIKQSLVVAFATTSLLSFASVAQAQQAPAAEEADTAVTEIIVSARRRNESLQDTPVAITAINSAMLENKASLTVGDLMGAAPNLLITNQNSGAAAANLSIRGLTYADVEKQLQQFDPVVASLTNSSELFCGFIAANECNRNNTSDIYTVFGSPALSDYSAPAGTLEMNYDFGDVKLTSVTGIRSSRENQTQDFDGSSTAPIGDIAARDRIGINFNQFADREPIFGGAFKRHVSLLIVAPRLARTIAPRTCGNEQGQPSLIGSSSIPGCASGTATAIRPFSWRTAKTRRSRYAPPRHLPLAISKRAPWSGHIAAPRRMRPVERCDAACVQRSLTA